MLNWTIELEQKLREAEAIMREARELADSIWRSDARRLIARIDAYQSPLEPPPPGDRRTA